MGIITALIGVVGGLFTAAASFWFAKKREQDAAWQKEKIGYYKAFIESLNDVVEGSATPEGDQEFDRATNNLLLFAPQSVLKAIKNFRELTDNEDPDSKFYQEEHDRLLADFLIEMRKDIGVRPPDDHESFDVNLYGYVEDEENP